MHNAYNAYLGFRRNSDVLPLLSAVMLYSRLSQHVSERINFWLLVSGLLLLKNNYLCFVVLRWLNYYGHASTRSTPTTLSHQLLPGHQQGGQQQGGPEARRPALAQVNTPSTPVTVRVNTTNLRENKLVSRKRLIKRNIRAQRKKTTATLVVRVRGRPLRTAL